MSTFSVFQITPEQGAHLDSAYSLLSETLGVDLFSRDGLQKFSAGENTLLIGCLVDGDLVAAAQARKLEKSGASFYAPFGKEAFKLVEHNVVGNLQNSAVRSDFRGKGIGTALLKERLRWMTSICCDHAVGVSWLHGKKDQSDRLYKAAGFQQIGPVVPEFFLPLSVSTGMRCIHCGYPCLCSAALYAKDIRI